MIIVKKRKLYNIFVFAGEIRGWTYRARNEDWIHSQGETSKSRPSRSRQGVDYCRLPYLFPQYLLGHDYGIDRPYIPPFDRTR